MPGTRRFEIVVLLLVICFSSALYASTVQMHIDVGLNHFHRQRYLEAFREFRAAAEKDPANAQAHFNLGRVYRAQGFLKEAIAQYQIALRLNPNYHSAQRELDSLMNDLDSDLRAKIRLEGQLSVAQQPPPAMSSDETERKARQLLNQGRIDEAIRYFEILLRTRPVDAGLLKLLGFLHYREERFTEAVDYYKRALQANRNDTETLYSLGVIKMNTNQPAKAQMYFQQAIDIRPTLIKAIFALGEAYEAQEKIDEAIFQFKQALDMNPQLTEAKEKLSYLTKIQGQNYFSRGSYYYGQANYEQAEALLSLAINFGSLSIEQTSQAQEMLKASEFWINQQQAKAEQSRQREQIRTESFVGRRIEVADVSRNPSPHVGRAVTWRGEMEYVREHRGKQIMLVNSRPSVNLRSTMEYAFEIHFPERLPDDRRIGLGAEIEVRGRVIGVERLLNRNNNIFSNRRQPYIEATEIRISRHDHAEPLVIRFY